MPIEDSVRKRDVRYCVRSGALNTNTFGDSSIPRGTVIAT